MEKTQCIGDAVVEKVRIINDRLIDLLVSMHQRDDAELYDIYYGLESIEGTVERALPELKVGGPNFNKFCENMGSCGHVDPAYIRGQWDLLMSGYRGEDLHDASTASWAYCQMPD